MDILAAAARGAAYKCLLVTCGPYWVDPFVVPHRPCRWSRSKDEALALSVISERMY